MRSSDVPLTTCPKCGREIEESAVICGGCDFILDSSFLGDDIMDAEREQRPKTDDKRPGPLPPSSSKRAKSAVFSEKTRASPAAPSDQSWAADAIILGKLDDDEVRSFQASDSGLAQREVTVARMYVGGSIQALLMPEAIPEIAPDIALDSVRITPFERHLLELVNGKRPVARIKKKAGLKDDDFQTALATLADKGFLRLAGRAKKVKKTDKEKEGDKQARDKRKKPLVEERTLIAEAPSVHELRSADDDDDASAFSASGPATDPVKESIHREVTLIQPPPSFDDEHDGARPTKSQRQRADGVLAYADSLLSEESVFSSAEDALARAADATSKPTAAPLAEKPARALRRPPLPGEVAKDSLLSDEAPTLPPPSVGPGGLDEPDEPDEPDEAADFADAKTGLLGPVSVDPDEISLVEMESPPLPAPPPLPGTIPQPPPTDPLTRAAGIDVSDFSDDDLDDAGSDGRVARKKQPHAVPPLPGAGSRPVTKAPVVAKAAPAAPAAPIPVAPAAQAPAAAPAPSPAAAPRSAEGEAADESDEGPPPADVPFEMLRKAEKMFEQAEKDFASGNVSSAVMNVKLATIYNPHHKRYRQFLEDWEAMQRQQSAPKPSKELRLLEDAQDAENRGDFERALELLETALEKAPKNAALHNRIGVLLATRLKRYAEAAQHVMTAIEQAPGNLAYKNNLGKILAKEDSAIHKIPEKREKKNDKGKPGTKDDRVFVKKLRPKLF